MNVRSGFVAGALTAAFFVSGLLVFLTPLPVCVLLARRRFADGVVSSGLAVILLAVAYALFFSRILSLPPSYSWLGGILPLPGASISASLGMESGLFFAVSYFVYYLFLGWLIGFCFVRQCSAAKTGAYAALGVTLFIFVVAGVLRWAAGIDVVSLVGKYFRFIIDQLVQIKSGESLEAPLAVLRDQADYIVAASISILPAFCWLAGLFVCVANMVSAKVVLRPFGVGQSMQPFRSFQAPFWLVWGVIGSGVVFFGDSYIARIGWPAKAGLNGLIGFMGVFLLQGFAVFQCLAIRLPILWKWLAYAMFLMWIQLTAPMLAFVGLADVWADFRTRLVGKKPV